MTAVRRTMTPDEERAWVAGGYVKAARGLGEVTPAVVPKRRIVDEVGCSFSPLCRLPPVAGSDRCARHLGLRL